MANLHGCFYKAYSGKEILEPVNSVAVFQVSRFLFCLDVQKSGVPTLGWSFPYQKRCKAEFPICPPNLGGYIMVFISFILYSSWASICHVHNNLPTLEGEPTLKLPYSCT